MKRCVGSHADVPPKALMLLKPVKSVQRLEQDIVHKASMRAFETHEVSVHRRQQDRMRKASMRTLETYEETVQHYNRIEHVW